MHHFTARSMPGTLLFHTWSEGCRLYEILGRTVPNVAALCVMPDHVHLQTRTDERRSFGVGLAAYARARNAKRGECGPVFRRTSPSEPLVGRDKVRRSERYIHLNPCRARLVDDPLAWPLSTYRACVGLTLAPVRSAVRDPIGYHRYTSADPTVNVQGTLLPATPHGSPTLEQLSTAVCALMRVSGDALHRKAAPRTLLLRAARTLTIATTGEIATFAGVTPRSVQRIDPSAEDAVRLIARVCGDPRFEPLPPGDLRSLYTWRRWAHHR